eukprot:SAG11_NODE_6399_length_1321_cov_1.560556_2_plen_71_part_00
MTRYERSVKEGEFRFEVCASLQEMVVLAPRFGGAITSILTHLGATAFRSCSMRSANPLHNDEPPASMMLR